METKIISAYSPEELNKILQSHLSEGWTLWSSNANYFGVVNGKTTIGLIISSPIDSKE